MKPETQLQILERLTKKAKDTPLGKKAIEEMSKQKTEVWVNDISPDGKVVGRFELISGKYE